jgi:hypothetical protein
VILATVYLGVGGLPRVIPSGSPSAGRLPGWGLGVGWDVSKVLEGFVAN